MEPYNPAAARSLPDTGREGTAYFRNDFEFFRTLPEELSALDRLSRNFYWSWHPEGVELFRELDPDLWIECEQSPRTMLRNTSDLRLWQQAADREYVEKLNAFAARFDEYISAANADTNAKIAYLCAEYGVHNSLPNYSGGLGILAGDHLKSSSDLNVPLVAVGLLYRFGYFRQDISHDGWQEEHYNDVFETDLALTPVVDASNERVFVNVHIRGRVVKIQAWLAKVGRIPLLLLDTNLAENTETDRYITGHLYGGDSETRIVQEKVLGIGGVRMLRKLGIAPEVFHLNEGHAAFSTLELAHEFIEKNPDADFASAISAIREQCVFTTHTPVAAGNDVFSPQLLMECFSADYFAAMKAEKEDFIRLGRVDPTDETEPFGMTPFALRMCRTANGVSEKHGEVSRGLWREMFPGLDEVPITHVTNGVHVPTWIASAFQRLYDEKIGKGWHELTRDADAWANAVNNISDSDIWTTHRTLKNLLIAFMRERTRRKDTGERDTINERSDTSRLCSPDVLTIGFARRVAQYKRWNLLLTDLERLLRLVDNAERPVQFIFAGKAHPQDRTAKQILQQLMSINHDSDWQDRAVFIEDYDQEVARYMVQGVDVWMNVPRRPHEASGTSGMKAAMNGILNFSTLDGWWIEGYDETNGFAVGDMRDFESDAEIDAIEAEALYSALENELVPRFYDRDENGFPAKWVAMMRNSITTLTPMFSSDRMVRDYLERIYTD
ncbi:MAG: alpha-glucan family phosphorylase [Acidobacteria bacterium]|nr:alpha-glucan family phosphorylase [Acidobacteriota bacterium]